MWKGHLKYLVCPECKNSLNLVEEKETQDDTVESGTLECSSCKTKFPIVRFIPRFVPQDNYANNFGLEWTIHARTQYDSSSGSNVSEDRFFKETKWPRNMEGQLILEVGGGSGRFTEQAASTDAMVISLDYSFAVESNYASNGTRANVLIIQADLYKMPFRDNSFDKLFCIGVLQHTPNVKKSFFALPHYVKSGGNIVVDVYPKFSFIRQIFKTKYWVRPLTKRMDPEFLYKVLKKYVSFIWPISKFINKLPYGKSLNWALLVGDYGGIYDLDDDVLKEWAILDTFDMLSPAHDHPQSIKTMKKWFKESELTNVDIHYGFNGIEARGQKP